MKLMKEADEKLEETSEVETDTEMLKRIGTNTELAFSYQKKDNWLARCRRLKDMLYGKYYKDVGDIEDKYIVNTVYQLVNLIIPFWFIQAPEVTAIPRRSFYTKTDPVTGGVARVNNIRASRKHQYIINDVLKKIDLEKEVRKALLDQLFYGISILKVGVVDKTERVESFGDNPKVKIFVKRVNPELFGFDPVSTEPNEARYLVEEIVKHKSSFENGKNYMNKDAASTDLPEDLEKYLKNTTEPTDFDVVVLKEYHDQENGEVLLFSGHSEKSLHRRSKNPFQFKGSHYSTLTLTKGNEDFVGIPPISMVEDHIYALIDSYSLTVGHQKLFPGQVVVESDAVDNDDLDSMEEACQGSIVTLQSGAIAGQKFQRLTALHLNQEYFQMLALHREMIERVLGIADSKAGLARKKSATESQLEAQDESIREADAMGMIKKWLVDIINKVSALIKQYYTEEDEVRILGKKGYRFIKYTKDDIQADCDYEFSVDSMRAARAGKAQILINAVNVLASNPVFQAKLAEKNLDGIIEYIFEQMIGMPQDYFDRDPEEMLPHNPEQENELFLNGEDVVDPHDDESHLDHAQIHFEIEDKMKDDPNWARHVKIHLDKHKAQMLQQQMMEQQLAAAGTAQNEPSQKGGTMPNPSTPAPNVN